MVRNVPLKFPFCLIFFSLSLSLTSLTSLSLLVSFLTFAYFLSFSTWPHMGGHSPLGYGIFVQKEGF